MTSTNRSLSSLIFCTALLLAATGCATKDRNAPGSQPQPDSQDNLATLARWMTGSFSSAAQADEQPAYFDIRLQMAPIWEQRDDGVWLYVEQARGDLLDTPYRQRVYHLFTRSDGAIISRVYELPGDPLRFAGAWAEPDAFKPLAPEDLNLRAGCDIVLQRLPDGSFVGGTEGTDCVSRLRDAQYATSEVTITSDSMISWDRGFNAADEQVWGATAGGYVFDKISLTPGARAE